jgi:hypothetical protein
MTSEGGMLKVTLQTLRRIISASVDGETSGPINKSVRIPKVALVLKTVDMTSEGWGNG